MKKQILQKSWEVLVMMLIIAGKLIKYLFDLKVYYIQEFWYLTMEDTSPARQKSAIFVAYFDI